MKHINLNKKYYLRNQEVNARTWFLILTTALFVILYLTGYEIDVLQSEILISNMKESGINYDSFREINITKNSLKQAEKKIDRILKKYPRFKKYPFMDAIGYLTFSMMADDFDLIDGKIVTEKTFMRGIGELAVTKSFQELYQYYDAILSDLTYFPVPEDKTKKADISYEDTWSVLRRYGGNRRHEGTDLMASNNIRGYFPVISITDGVVEKMGWLEQGGYRIGIRSLSGAYIYYAHLNSYAPELYEGDQVIAGQLLGFMGDSGYGSEGTVGKFDVHLHVGIYVPTKTGDMSVNPYRLLKILEHDKLKYINK